MAQLSSIENNKLFEEANKFNPKKFIKITFSLINKTAYINLSFPIELKEDLLT